MARVKWLTPGTPSRRETMGVNVMLMISGAIFTVSTHLE